MSAVDAFVLVVDTPKRVLPPCGGSSGSTSGMVEKEKKKRPCVATLTMAHVRQNPEPYLFSSATPVFGLLPRGGRSRTFHPSTPARTLEYT